MKPPHDHPRYQGSLGPTLRQPLRELLLGILGWLLAGTLRAAGAQVCGGALLTDMPPSPGAQFGCSVFIQGDTLAVGANLDRPGPGPAATGSVIVFARDPNGSGWDRKAKLAPPELRDGAQFGFAAAISGNTLAVGAPFDDSVQASGSGAVYVFRRSGDGWDQEAKLAAAEVATGDGFGLNLAASGDVLAIGAPFSSRAGSLAGAVYVFRRTGGGWSEEAVLSAGDQAPFAAFGYSVAVNGATLLAGAPFAHGPSAGPGSGAAYVFVGNGGTWVQQAQLTAQGAAAGAEFGAAVAVAGGGPVVVGARRDTVAGQANAGAAYAFDDSSGSWQQTDRLVAPDAAGGALFGVSLSLSGAHLLVGARGASGVGAAYVFTRDQGGTGHWSSSGKRTPASATAGASFGQSVAASGNDLVVGGPLDDSRSGAVAFCQLPFGSLAINLDDSVTQVLPGETVVYTLTVSNRGNETVTGAVVTDAFPPQLVNVRWCPPQDGPGCAQPRTGDIQDTLDLPAGVPKVYTITAQIAADASGTITDQACIAAPAFGVAPGSVCATDTDTVQRVDLVINVDDGVTQVLPGETVVYILTVSNRSNETVTGAVVTDMFPPQLRHVRWCPPQDRTGCALPHTGDIHDTLDLPAGVPKVYTITAQIAPDARGTITDKACVAAPAFGVLPDSHCSTDTDTVPSADLALVMSAPATVAMGGVLTYDLQVTNRGPSPATGVRLTDPWPPGLGPLAPGDPRCIQDQGRSRFSCALGTLPAGGSVSLRLGFSVPACYQAPTPIVNTAAVTANEPDTDPSNNTATVRTTLVAAAGAAGGPACPADLAIRFSPDAEITAPTAGTAPLGLGRTRRQPRAAAGAALDEISVLYTVNVQNTGTADLAGAKVRGAFSPSLKRILWCKGLGCMPAIPGPLADSVPLAALETAVYQVKLTVPPNFNDFVCHTVTATLPGGEVDPTPQDDSASELRCLTHGALCSPPPPGFCAGRRQPDLEVAFVRDPEIDPLAGKVLYTVAVQNGGSADAVAAQVSSVFSPTIAPVLWCRGLGCTPANPGPLADVLTVPAGQTVVYQVELTVPCDFAGSALLYTVSAAPGGGLEAGPPDNSQSELLCLTFDDECQLLAGSCPSAPPPSHPDLDVELVGAPEIDFAEGKAVYTVLVQNGGGADAVAALVSGTAQVSGSGSDDRTAAWCRGLGCTPTIEGPLSDTRTIQAGDFAAYEVAVGVPAGFHDNVCFTVSAKVPGDLEPGPQDSTRTELMCLTDGPPCPPPPPGFCPEDKPGHPDLEVAFIGDPVPDGAAGTVLYTVSLQNAGDAAAVGAKMSSLFSAFSSSAIGPVSWCKGLGCTPTNPGPLGETLTVPAGAFLFYQVLLHLPLSFNDFLCYTVTATVLGNAELIPDNTQNEPLCVGSEAFCSSPPPGFCFHID